MANSSEFEKACENAKKLPAQSNDTLLQLYAYFKQATQGDVVGARPGMFAVRDRAKYDAWAKLKGLDRVQAEGEYVALVGRLLNR